MKHLLFLVLFSSVTHAAKIVTIDESKYAFKVMQPTVIMEAMEFSDSHPVNRVVTESDAREFKQCMVGLLNNDVDHETAYQMCSKG